MWYHDTSLPSDYCSGLTCSAKDEGLIGQLSTVSNNHQFVHSALQQVLEREALDQRVNLSSFLKSFVWVVQKDVVPAELTLRGSPAEGQVPSAILRDLQIGDSCWDWKSQGTRMSRHFGMSLTQSGINILVDTFDSKHISSELRCWLPTGANSSLPVWASLRDAVDSPFQLTFLFLILIGLCSRQALSWPTQTFTPSKNC